MISSISPVISCEYTSVSPNLVGIDPIRKKISDILKRSLPAFEDIKRNLEREVRILAKTASYLYREIIKISLIATFVYTGIILVCPPALVSEAAIIILIAPLIEEIFFRGIVLPSIEIFQKCYNGTRLWMHKETPTETDLKTQKIWRIRISAVAFGLAHATNPHSHLIQKVLQVSLSTLWGITTGYLKEKTDSLAPPFLAHATNNAFAFTLEHTSKRSHLLVLWPLWALNFYNWYQLSTKED